MKRGLLLVSMFIMVSTFGAIASTKATHVVDFNPGYYSEEGIEFVERGIKFYVFLDGEFDFTTSQTGEVDYIYRNRIGRRTKHYYPRGIRIERDYQGRIRRVGNVFISYTYNDKIKRIGSVFIKYRRDRMKKVGNLKIYYDRYGVRYVGSVKRHYYNPYYSNGWSSFNDWNTWDTWEYGYYDPFFEDDNFYEEYESFNEDDNYYYYRSKAKSKRGKSGKKAKKGKVIKRKKANKSKPYEKRRKMKNSKKTTYGNIGKMKRTR